MRAFTKKILTALLTLLGLASIFALRSRAPSSLSPPRVFASTNHITTARSSLQARLDAAQAGDTIFVQTGVYEGNLVLDKRLVLIGQDEPVLRGEGRGSCVVITADSCVLKGFVIERSGAMLVQEDAGVLVKSHGNAILQNTLRDVLFGIYLLHADDNLVADNTISGRKQLELGERGSGIHLWNSQRNRFAGNVITDVRDGFYIQNANHTIAERNEVFNVRYGLHYMYADSNVFVRNKFYGNVAGAAIMYSRGIRIRHNVFAHNRGFSSFGILLQDCHDSLADSNIIADNVVGVFFEASTNNVFRHNLIASNDIGLQMYQNSVGNTFTENNFVENLNPLRLVGKRTETHWSQSGRGNYWSSYEGYDLDHNGVGDVPMKIQNVFDYLEGRSPNLRLYLYSPVAQALAAATKAFPVIAINQEADEHPLMRPVALRLD